LVFLLLAIAVVRIATTYRVLSQAVDEPATVAAGMEWLDTGTYVLDPFHPPLARVASALGPYLAGLRLPAMHVIQPGRNVFDIGDDILNSGGHYWRTLTLARIGMLPFFALGVLVVFLWTREIAGNAAAVFAVLLFTTLPPVLAFAGFAYTDLPVAVLIAASTFLLTHWLEQPRLRTTILLGVVTALALLANFPALLFLPTCWAVVIACWWRFSTKEQHDWRRSIQQAVWAALAFALVLWGGYRFSVEPLHRVLAKPAEHVSKLHLPAPLHRVLNGVIAVDPPLPAAPLFKGIALNMRPNLQGRYGYLLGEVRSGGWWYFFPVVLAVKTPLPFLLLAVLGGAAMLKLGWTNREWRPLVPGFCALAVLLATVPVKADHGVRNILSVYPLLAVLAGYGSMQLWRVAGRWRWPARAALAGLLAWQMVSTSRIHPDYVAYFNELAGQHPEKILLWGCDYDCGQDTARLAQLLHERNISHVAVSVFGSSDFAGLGFPSFEVLSPDQRTTGWVAASVRRIHTGDVGWWGGDHPDMLKWLMDCQPVARAGRTIYLYYLPCAAPQTDRKQRDP
jgi:hypothetical protein